jgi:hypothetical protein
MGASGTDDDSICVWDPANQSIVRDDLEFQQQPSALRIWWTQENLWVYHALLDVIKNTNAAVNATRSSNAAVRAVISLEVGQRAAPSSRTPNRIYKLPTAVPAGGDPMALAGEQAPGPDGSLEAGGAPSFSEFSASGPDGSGQMDEAQEQGYLLNGRYLDKDGKPIPAGGASADPTAVPDPSIPAPPVDLTAFGKEYKRLPIRMVLVMDQRQLPTLISECAIRPLQIEVQEVRINPADVGGSAGEIGGMSPMRGPMSGGGGIGGEMTMPDLTGLQEFNPQPQIATVVVQGVIYIFNKPDPSILQPDAEATAETPLAAQ